MKETVLDSDFFILNRLPNLYSARRFQQEIDQNKLNGRLVTAEWLIENLSRIETLADHRVDGPVVLYRQGDYNFWPTQTRLSESRLRLINSPSEFLRARDKWVTYQSWQKNQIPMPTTFSFSDYLENVSIKDGDTTTTIATTIFHHAADRIGIPFIVKKRFSSQGRDVFLVASSADLEKIWLQDAPLFQHLDDREINYFKNEFLFEPPSVFVQLQRWLFQKCITESLGTDIRTFVLPDIHYSIERKNENSHVSNLHQGGHAQATTLTATESQLIQKIHTLSNLTYSGIDFLRTTTGPKFLETNPSPGFEGIESIHKTNIANKLIKIISTTKTPKKT